MSSPEAKNLMDRLKPIGERIIKIMTEEKLSPPEQIFVLSALNGMIHGLAFSETGFDDVARRELSLAIADKILRKYCDQAVKIAVEGSLGPDKTKH